MITDKDIYHNICKTLEAKLPIFYQDWWLDISCQNGGWSVNIDIAENMHINGIWPVHNQVKLAQNFVVEAPFTPYLSPLSLLPKNITKQSKIYSFEDEVNHRLISTASKKAFKRFRLQPGKGNWYSFYKAKWRSHLRYTYTLHELKNTKRRQEHYKASVRNDIKKANSRFTIIEETNPSNLVRLHQLSVNQKGSNKIEEANILSELCLAALDRNKGFILSAKDQDDQIVTSCFVVYDRQSAYLLSLGVDKSMPILGSVQLLINAAINKSSQHTDCFDFEGSMISEVEPVFRAFGGKRTPVIEVSWAPKWGEIVFILLNKGRW